jgi:uncharacterized protein YndB with AHSA1/START domain
MPHPSAPAELELSGESWYPVPVERVWAQCTSKLGLESWWSPEDLRTTVKRIEPRLGGEILLSLRFAPAMVGQTGERAFRAAGVPIAFTLRGKFLEWENHRHLALSLGLTLDRAGGELVTITQLDFQPEANGTRVRMLVRGGNEPHLVTLGKTNLDGQLTRLGRSLGVDSTASP